MSPARRPADRPRLRLLHIEGDRLLLLGLRGAAPRGWRVTSLGTARGGAQRLPDKVRWDVCLVGVGDEPGAVRDALTTLMHMSRIGCPLVVSMPTDAAQYVLAVAALGVRGFVSRSAPFEELRTAITEVAAGRVFMDERLRSRLPGKAPGSVQLDLTELQWRVAGLYVLRGNRSQVAQDLHVSENTVKYHLRHIYARTGLSSVHELHQLLLSRGWSALE